MHPVGKTHDIVQVDEIDGMVAFSCLDFEATSLRCGEVLLDTSVHVVLHGASPQAFIVVAVGVGGVKELNPVGDGDFGCSDFIGCGDGSTAFCVITEVTRISDRHHVEREGLRGGGPKEDGRGGRNEPYNSFGGHR